MKSLLETTTASSENPSRDHEIAVDLSEFRRLIVSHRRLVRADQPGRRRLRDVETGHIYWLDERRILAAR